MLIMRRLLFIVALLAAIACEKEQNETIDMSGITMDSYPRVDGSTSTKPLNYIIASELLGLEYVWMEGGMGGREVTFKNHYELPQHFREKLLCSQTHNAIVNLINGQVDIIIVARKMSAGEQRYADSLGVSLLETPIALDALDFILNAKNSVNSLTVEQIQSIYLGNTTRWSELGGANEAIKPFIRNANSGSQEMMNEIVMNSAGMPDWEVSLSDAENMTLWSMLAVYQELRNYPNGICFTPHYYKEYMMNAYTAEGVKTLAVNGIMPDKSSIKNKTYPFVANVFVSIRSDLNSSSNAYKIYSWLQTKEGRKAVEESGYVPN